jgi:hypothetical protein
MPKPIIIRCSVPDCEWGFEASDSSRVEQCYRAYSQHYKEMHGADAESFIHLDLRKTMLSLKK